MIEQEEGYIKFNCLWDKTSSIENYNFSLLNYWRDKLYHKHLIGAYQDGIGYGNISERLAGTQFVITGFHIPSGVTFW